MKFYEIENRETYCYANDEKNAKFLFLENDEDLEETEINVFEVDGKTVIYCEEIVGAGGYSTISLEDIIANNKVPQYIGTEDDIRTLQELYYFMIVDK